MLGRGGWARDREDRGSGKGVEEGGGVGVMRGKAVRGPGTDEETDSVEWSKCRNDIK